MPRRSIAQRSSTTGTLALLPLLAGLTTPLPAQIDYATPYSFGVFAGSGLAGSTDGTGTAAQLDRPYGIALDSSGNLYVADRGNQTIRKITAAGAVTTIAGTVGITGSGDGTGSEAQFNQPGGIAVGSSGNLYVTDTGSSTIRKITTAGVVTTLAGTVGTSGSTNATGTAAEFNQPFGIAIDSSGNLYVAELGNDMIRKVTSAGVVTTLAGGAGVQGSLDGTGTAALFNQPIGIAIDGSGNLYVTDAGNNTIRKVTSAGVVTTIAGTAGQSGTTDGIGAAARFNSPRGIAVDGDGNLFVADSANGTIRRITPAGAVTTLAGRPDTYASESGTGAGALFDVPVSTAVDSGGNVYVSCNLGNLISKGAVASSILPAITQQPASQTISAGSTVVFQAAASGLPAPGYQWTLNGNALVDGPGVSGSASSTLVVSGAGSSSAGSYACTVTNSAGSVTSSPATLAISASADIGRLINLSCRAQVGTGANILIAGFAVGGAGTTGSETLLVRASGPALAPFDVAGTLGDPQLELFSGSATLGTDFGWGGSSLIEATADSVGAFPWTDAASLDSALVETLAAGPYSAEISGKAGDTGISLVEVYDATPAGSYTQASARLINLSAREQVGTGGGVLIAGFVIGGDTARTVLIRASGPAIAAAPFSLPGTLPDPELQLYSGASLLATNAGWAGNPQISAAAARVGAFAWSSASSSDSAFLITLPPGDYTAQVAGQSGDSGLALIEVYEVP